MLLENVISAMVDQTRSEIIKSNPIGGGLNAFHVSFSSIYEHANITCTPNALDQLAQDGRVGPTSVHGGIWLTVMQTFKF